MSIYSGSRTRVSILNQPRNTLRERDSLTSYPTLQRTSGDDRLGEISTFDDTDTIVFSSNSSFKYPIMLPVSGTNYYKDWEIENTLITTAGVCIKGISDALIYDLSGSSLKEKRQNKPIGPFVEIGGQHSPRTNDIYWISGSSELFVGEGFKQPTYSKTQIVIDITPSALSSFGQEDYANDLATPPFTVDKPYPEMYPMAYFNFQDRKWDKIGTGSIAGAYGTTSEEQAAAVYTTWAQNSCIGFSNGFNVTVDDYEVGYAACRPISNFGFPLHEKFHATGSQLLNMSDYINSPFLLEKFIVEMTCEFTSSRRTDPLGYGDNYVIEIERVQIDGTSYAGLTANTMAINTLFLLNQRVGYSGSNNWNIESDPFNIYPTLLVTSSIPNNIVLSKAGEKQQINTIRDIVGYAQLVSYSGSISGIDQSSYYALGGAIETILDRGLRRELALNVSRNWALESSSGQGGLGPTSFSKRQIILSGSCRDIPKAQNVSAYNIVAHNGNEIGYEIINMPGGYNNIDGIFPTGRHINSTITTTLKSSGLHYVPGIRIPLTTATSGSYDRPAPYLLLPSDKLLLGWQVPLPLGIHTYVSGNVGKTHSVVKVFPEVAKLTLIGSLVRENKEFHDVRNDPINTNAIHEALHYDNSILDQFDAALKHELSGTYLDAYITGSLISRVDNVVTPIFNGRSKIFSNTDSSTQTGSIQSTDKSLYFKPKKELAQIKRFIKLEDLNKRNYDSLIPNILQMIIINGGNFYTSSSAGEIIGILACNAGGLGSLYADKHILQSYPFESRYGNLERVNNLIEYEGTDVNGDKNFYRKFILNTSLRHKGSLYTTIRMMSVYGDAAADQSYEPISVKTLNKYIFGIGDGLHKVYASAYSPFYPWYELGSGPTGAQSMPTPRLVSKYINYQILGMSDPLVRGWRYGLDSAIPTYKSVIFRRDRYGQPRDMLEQSLDTKVLVQTPRTIKSAAPVNVRFIDKSSGLSTQPENTWALNLSYEITSSLPYFDGIMRSRPEININTLNQTLVTLTQDNNGNLVI